MRKDRLIGRVGADAVTPGLAFADYADAIASVCRSACLQSAGKTFFVVSTAPHVEKVRQLSNISGDSPSLIG